MKRILRDVPTVRISLDGGDWVEIKARRQLGDQVAIDQATITGKIRSVGGEMELGELALGATVSATLARMVVRWGGPGFCQVDHGADGTDGPHFDPGEARPEGVEVLCRPEPCDAAALVALDDVTAQTILKEIEARNPRPKKGAEANPTSAPAASG